jgi:hypothetical protein
MFVTLKVFKLIGPSNEGRRHGRSTYLFFLGSARLYILVPVYTCHLGSSVPGVIPLTFSIHDKAMKL